MQTYRATLSFSGISDSDTVTPLETNKDGDQNEGSNLESPIKVSIGNFVSWTSNGVDRFKSRKVEWISEDGLYLRVFGSPTGIPMTEVELAQQPNKPIHPLFGKSQNAPDVIPASNTGEDITVYLAGQRLQITADVDISGIEKLEKMLAKYKEILQMLQ